jgi:hypothetical protein
MSDQSSEFPVKIVPFSDKNIVVQGDYDAYAKVMKKFSARWNSRLKVGAGWLVPCEFESAVRMYFGLEDAKTPVKYRPAPSTRKVVETHVHEGPEVSPIEEEEPIEIARPVMKPIPASIRRSTQDQVKSVNASVKVSRKPTLETMSYSLEERDEEDIVSLAKRMKDLMNRVDRLEGK